MGRGRGGGRERDGRGGEQRGKEGEGKGRGGERKGMGPSYVGMTAEKYWCVFQARRQGGFEGVRSNPPFGLQKILYTLL